MQGLCLLSLLTSGGKSHFFPRTLDLWWGHEDWQILLLVLRSLEKLPASLQFHMPEVLRKAVLTRERLSTRRSSAIRRLPSDLLVELSGCEIRLHGCGWLPTRLLL